MYEKASIPHQIAQQRRKTLLNNNTDVEFKSLDGINLLNLWLSEL